MPSTNAAPTLPCLYHADWFAGYGDGPCGVFDYCDCVAGVGVVDSRTALPRFPGPPPLKPFPCSGEAIKLSTPNALANGRGAATALPTVGESGGSHSSNY